MRAKINTYNPHEDEIVYVEKSNFFSWLFCMIYNSPYKMVKMKIRGVNWNDRTFLLQEADDQEDKCKWYKFGDVYGEYCDYNTGNEKFEY